MGSEDPRHMSAITTVTYGASMVWGILINLMGETTSYSFCLLCSNSNTASRWFCLVDDFGTLLLLGPKEAQQAKEDQRSSCQYDHTHLWRSFLLTSCSKWSLPDPLRTGEVCYLCLVKTPTAKCLIHEVWKGDQADSMKMALGLSCICSLMAQRVLFPTLLLTWAGIIHFQSQRTAELMEVATCKPMRMSIYTKAGDACQYGGF